MLGPRPQIDDLGLLADIIGVDSAGACTELFARQRGQADRGNNNDDSSSSLRRKISGAAHSLLEAIEAFVAFVVTKFCQR
jgi:hypothetical protein